jgi:hypothetical protein
MRFEFYEYNCSVVSMFLEPMLDTLWNVEPHNGNGITYVMILNSYWLYFMLTNIHNDDNTKFKKMFVHQSGKVKHNLLVFSSIMVFG